jgi:hypothetical protein
VFGQLPAEPDLGQASTVLRCGVKEPGSVLPGGVDRGGGLLVGEFAEHDAQRGGTET